MKKLLATTLIALGLLVAAPTVTNAAFNTCWQATSTTQGDIFPCLINGILQRVTASHFHASSTNATSTFAGGIGGLKALSVIGNDPFVEIKATTGNRADLYLRASNNPTITWSCTVCAFQDVLQMGYDLGTERSYITTLDTTPLELGVNGTTRVYFQNNGTNFTDTTTFNVPIIVNGPGTSTFAGGLTGPGSFTIQQSSGRLGVGTSSPYATASIEQQAGTIPVFAVADQGTTSPIFVINPDGKVGIGTTTPRATLGIHAFPGVIPFAIGSTTAKVFEVADTGKVEIRRSNTLDPLLEKDAHLVFYNPHASGQTLGFVFVQGSARTVRGGVRSDFQGNFNWHATGPQGHQYYASSNTTQPILGMSNSGLVVGDCAGCVSSQRLEVLSKSTSNVVAGFRGFSGQTADLTQWLNSSETVLSRIDKDGDFGHGTSTPWAKLSVVSSGSIGTPSLVIASSTTSLPDVFVTGNRNWMGLGTTSPRGPLEIAGISITTQSSPSNGNMVINYGSGNYSAFGNCFSYTIYAYKTVGAGRVYSSPTSASDCDDSSEQPLTISVSWTAASGANGYRIIITNSAFGAFDDYYYETSSTSFTDGDGTEASFVACGATCTATPTVAVTHTGNDIYATTDSNLILTANSKLGIGTTSPATQLHVSAGATATTTVEFGAQSTSAKTCFNVRNNTGAATSFYFVGTTMVVEAGRCK